MPGKDAEGVPASPKATEAPWEQSHRYETIVESVPDAIYMLDPDGRITWINEIALNEFNVGYERDDLIGEHASILLDDRDLDRALTLIHNLLDDPTANSGRCDVKLRGPDADKDAELHLTLLRDDDGQFRGTIGVLRDISERKRAEDRLQRHTARVTRLHEVATDITAAESNDEIYQRTADSAADLFSCGVARVSVADGGHLVPVASSIDEALDEYQPVPVSVGYAGLTYQNQQTVRIGDLHLTRSVTASCNTSHPSDTTTESGLDDDHPGEAIDADRDGYRSLLSVPLGDRGVLQVFATERDAFDERDEELADLLATHASTALDRVEAEASIRRERDRLSEFAGILSHDLRNPLEVAHACIELSRIDDEDPEEHLDEAETALERMREIIDDVLSLARQGETVGDLTRVDLEVVARQAWATVENNAATLRYNDLGAITADRSRVVELFENLFRNAIEHGGEDVTVTVGHLDQGFYIEDTGPGISPADRDRVFENGYSTSEDGTGFGLAIVKRIAEAHGWELRVTAGEEGGARFELRSVECVHPE